MMKMFQRADSGPCRPKITYPCRWQYTIIGESRADICQTVRQHIREEPLQLTDSNVSRNGRYISMNLEVTVHSEEQRRELYTLLAAHPTIKVVL